MAGDRIIAAITICAEASSATPAERRMVAWTLFNRLALKDEARYGATIAAVCLKRMQYSEWNGDRVDNRNLLRVAQLPDDDPLFMDCLAAYDEVKAAVEKGEPDPTQGSAFYWDHSIPAPYWSRPPAVITVQTDKFTFCKGVP